MVAKFYVFSKDDTSTKQPADNIGTEYNITLKEPTSLTEPVFTVHISSVDRYNYVKFSGRYYFVNDIVILTNDLCEYHCTCDVMASWKAFIGASTEYVLRSKVRYDTYIIDSSFAAKAKCSYVTTLLSDLDSRLVGNVNQGFYLVGVIGSGVASSGCVNYYVLTPAGFSNLMGYMFNILNYNIDASEVGYALQKAILNPFQYIVSATWYPFVTAAPGASEYVDFGWWQSSIGGFKVANSDRMLQFTSGTVELPQHPQVTTNGYFLNSSPYTRRTLYAYMFGTIPLDPLWFPNLKMIVSIRCDVFTGIGELIIANDLGNIVYRQSAQMGVPVQLAQMNQSTMEQIGGFLQAGIGYALGDQTSAYNTSLGQVQMMGSQGSDVGYRLAPRVESQFYEVCEVDDEHNGKPLCKNVQISTLYPGYIKVSDARVEISGTKTEQDKIRSIMESGFFYE